MKKLRNDLNTKYVLKHPIHLCKMKLQKFILTHMSKISGMIKIKILLTTVDLGGLIEEGNFILFSMLWIFKTMNTHFCMWSIRRAKGPIISKLDLYIEIRNYMYPTTPRLVNRVRDIVGFFLEHHMWIIKPETEQVSHISCGAEPV